MKMSMKQQQQDPKQSGLLQSVRIPGVLKVQCTFFVF